MEPNPYESPREDGEGEPRRPTWIDPLVIVIAVILFLIVLVAMLPAIMVS